MQQNIAVLMYNTFIIKNIGKSMIRYYFLLATQDFLLRQEPIEEILRERIRHYKSLNKDIDFWLTTDLSFLDIVSLGIVKKQLVKPSVAIVSLNPKFIDWLKLRIHYAFKGSYVTSSSLNITNSLISVEQFSD